MASGSLHAARPLQVLGCIVCSWQSGSNTPGKHLQQEGGAHASDGLCLLTEREREILCLLAHGLTTDAISNQLHISMTTVRNHVQRLMAKMNVHSRIEAVTCAHRHQLV